MESYNRTFKQFIEYCEGKDSLYINNIDESLFYGFFDYKAKKTGSIQQSSKQIYLIHLKMLFNYISDKNDDLLDFLALTKELKVKTKIKIPEGLNANEKIKLLNYLELMSANETILQFRNILIVKILYYSGIRASELLSINLKKIYLNRDKDLFTYKVLGKGKKERLVYFPRSVAEEEIEFLLKNSITKINTTSNGKSMDRVQLYKMVNSILRRAGIKKRGVHLLRHTFAEAKVDANINISTIQGLLGHSNIQTTMRYAKTNEGNKQEAVRI
jgi:integrase/recombinase XerD